jgi:hypothetical protein
MSISSLRWRALSAVIAPGAAVAAVLALAVPAAASTGTQEISPEQAGYTATGAQFKAVNANVWLRGNTYGSEVAGFGDSVQLWSSGLVVTVGVTTSSWEYLTYATIYNRSTHRVIASDPNSVFCAEDDNCYPGTGYFYPGYDSGYPIGMGIGYNPATGVLSMGEDDSGDGFTFTASYTVAGQSFTEARIGTDFGSTPWDNSYSYTPPAKYLKVARYTDVSLTGYSGHTATLWSWWVHHKLLANTEQQSGSDWVAVPADLTDGGASFQTLFVPQSAQGPNQPALP